MTISHIGAAQANATSVDISGLGISTGDLLIAALLSSSSTRPTIPADWISIVVIARSNVTVAVCYRRVVDGSETASGFTNAAGVVVSAYRSDAGIVTVGGVNQQNGVMASTTFTWPILPSYTAVANNVPSVRGQSPVSSRILLVAGVSLNDTSLSNPPTGYTNRGSSWASFNRLALHDSNADVYSVGSAISVTLGFNMSYCSTIINIVEESVSVGSGGGASGFSLSRLINLGG